MTVSTTQVIPRTGIRQALVTAISRIDDRVPFLVAAVALAASLALPYWHMTLLAPQYPGGLRVWIYLTKLAGDVQEVNGLNHYIGMMKLEEAATFERAIAPYGVAALAALALLAAVVRRRWTAWLSLLVVVFPLIFIADLQYWLWYFGHHLDPHAALSSAIKPFTPPVLGTGRVGQFVVETRFGSGLYLAVLAALSTIVGVFARLRGPVQRG
ncbi:cytochrome C [Thermomicrobium sp. 4228-Ro]|uniref:cytochrome C n=1 Tax=Thermomicrobium sp. 4228-Ro TaxID=2993937 RepID=UPI002249A1FB|nr:cytochrome C [Thermomicrobium sp. 4228-Ro]MCX2728198.1 cytochrome C [Thermomicrobium sp. 4228-Ro]